MKISQAINSIKKVRTTFDKKANLCIFYPIIDIFKIFMGSWSPSYSPGSNYFLSTVLHGSADYFVTKNSDVLNPAFQSKSWPS